MRLIDADVLRKQHSELCPGDCSSCDYCSATNGKLFCSLIDNAPTIDAEPVQHGRWELETSKYLRRCSACEKVTFYCGAGRHYDYCPNCGAKMDEEVEE